MGHKEVGMAHDHERISVSNFPDNNGAVSIK